MPETDTELQHGVLAHLLRAGDAFVLWSELNRTFRADSGRMLRVVEQLIRAGCRIEQHPQSGLRLIESGLGVWTDFLEAQHAGVIGRKVRVYQEVTSTQDAARQLIGAEDFDGAVVLADRQSAGRGRLGRKWFSPPGAGLLLTVAVRGQTESPERWTVGACCALAWALEREGAEEVSIRWPNDLLLSGKKVAGILVERVGEAVLVGIGMNVRHLQNRLPDQDSGRMIHATSLAEQGLLRDRLHVADRLLTMLEEALRKTSLSDLAQAWRERSSLFQKRITVRIDRRLLTGRVIDLDLNAGLLLEVERGPVVALPSALTSLEEVENQPLHP